MIALLLLACAARGPVDEVEALADALSTTEPATDLLLAEPEVVIDDPDFANAVAVRADATPNGALLTLDIAPGYHLYGAREAMSLPLEVTVHDLPELVVEVPPGAQKDLGELGVAWVLTGRQRVDVVLPGPPTGPTAGGLRYQVCTHSLCSMPITADWSTADRSTGE